MTGYKETKDVDDLLYQLFTEKESNRPLVHLLNTNTLIV